MSNERRTNCRDSQIHEWAMMATFAKKASEFWRSKSGVIEFDGAIKQTYVLQLHIAQYQL